MMENSSIRILKLSFLYNHCSLHAHPDPKFPSLSGLVPSDVYALNLKPVHKTGVTIMHDADMAMHHRNDVYANGE
jgi:hypothetical protein